MESRTAWIGVLLVARLLMFAVLVTTAVRTSANHTKQPYGGAGGNSSHQLQSHTRLVVTTPNWHHAYGSSAPTCVDAACMYMMCRVQRSTMIAAAAIGAAASALQIPVAVYLIDKSRRRSAYCSFWTDMVVTLLLFCAFSLGYASRSYDDLAASSGVDESARRDLIGYYDRAKLPLALLFVGMLLSMAATLISALHLPCAQATATNDDVVADIV